MQLGRAFYTDQSSLGHNYPPFFVVGVIKGPHVVCTVRAVISADPASAAVATPPLGLRLAALCFSPRPRSMPGAPPPCSDAGSDRHRTPTACQKVLDLGWPWRRGSCTRVVSTPCSMARVRVAPRSLGCHGTRYVQAWGATVRGTYGTPKAGARRAYVQQRPLPAASCPAALRCWCTTRRRLTGVARACSAARRPGDMTVGVGQPRAGAL